MFHYAQAHQVNCHGLLWTNSDVWIMFHENLGVEVIGDFHRFSVAMFDYQRVRFLMYVIVYIKWLLQMTSQCGASTSTMPSC